MDGTATRSLTLTLPYPPSVNTYWRTTRTGGRVYLSAAAKDYRNRVYESVSCSSPLTGRLRVVVRLRMPDRRRRDIDNITKSLLDALEHAGVFEDDSQIDELRVSRGEVLKPGAAIVEITEFGE